MHPCRQKYKVALPFPHLNHVAALLFVKVREWGVGTERPQQVLRLQRCAYLITGKQREGRERLTTLFFGSATHVQNARLLGIPPFLSARLCPSTGLDFVSRVLHLLLLARDLGSV